MKQSLLVSALTLVLLVLLSGTALATENPYASSSAVRSTFRSGAALSR
jgi:hypothetical protein